MKDNKRNQKQNSCKVRALLGCLLGICLLSAVAVREWTAAAASTNQVVVLLKDGEELIEGAKLGIYQVADGYGHEMKLKKTFEKANLTWDEVEKQPRISAEVVESYVLDENTTIDPSKTAVTGEDGKANFRVADGVYLVRYLGDALQYDRTVEMASFLVTIPVTDNNGVLVRKAECRAKCSQEKHLAPANKKPRSSSEPADDEDDEDVGTPPPESRAAVQTDEEHITETIKTVEIGDPDTARSNKLLSDKNKNKNKNSSNKTSHNSKPYSSTTRTGDDFPLAVCVAVLVTSGALFTLVCLWRRKRR